ncbi:MAG: hypothetical protein RIC56_10210 [Pseudomonadales bacterium]
MSRRRPVAGRTWLPAVVLAVAAVCPLAAVADTEVPAAVVALLPDGASLGKGGFEVIETEFGKTFVGSLQAASFAGQRPSCVYAGTPELQIELKGDTAFEAPPMLDMAISIYEQDVERTPAAMSNFTTTYIEHAPDVVSVGSIHDEALGSGRVVYVEYAEDCASHPQGAKTRLQGFARRGATQLSFNLVVALDSAAALAMARQIIDRFDALDIAALTD